MIRSAYERSVCEPFTHENVFVHCLQWQLRGVTVGRGAHFIVTLHCRSDRVSTCSAMPLELWVSTAETHALTNHRAGWKQSWALHLYPRIVDLIGQIPLIPTSQGILRRRKFQLYITPKEAHRSFSWGLLELNPYLHQGYVTCWRRNDGPDALGLVSGRHAVLIHDHTSVHDSWQAAGTAHFTETEHRVGGGQPCSFKLWILGDHHIAKTWFTQFLKQLMSSSKIRPTLF